MTDQSAEAVNESAFADDSSLLNSTLPQDNSALHSLQNQTTKTT